MAEVKHLSWATMIIFLPTIYTKHLELQHRYIRDEGEVMQPLFALCIASTFKNSYNSYNLNANRKEMDVHVFYCTFQVYQPLKCFKTLVTFTCSHISTLVVETTT